MYTSRQKRQTIAKFSIGSNPIIPIYHFDLIMTKEERKEWYHNWYWNRGGREQTLQRRKERGLLKWGTKLNNGNQ